MCWMIINCIGSLFGSNRNDQPQVRVEAIGPNRDNLFRLQNTIYSYVSPNQVTVSIFATSSAKSLQVTMNKKGRSIPIYNGQDETDYEGIAASVAGYVWGKKHMITKWNCSLKIRVYGQVKVISWLYIVINNNLSAFWVRQLNRKSCFISFMLKYALNWMNFEWNRVNHINSLH